MSDDTIGIGKCSDSLSAVSSFVSRGSTSENSVASVTSSYVSAVGACFGKNSSAAW